MSKRKEAIMMTLAVAALIAGLRAGPELLRIYALWIGILVGVAAVVTAVIHFAAPDRP